MTINRWSKRKANAWYAAYPWLVGCNFIPSTAINQLEMWQADTFDLATIGRELSWAADLGFNTARVYLHDLLWEQDSAGFRARIDAFLQVTIRLGIFPMFVLFDDCWNDQFHLGKQPDPVPGVHNSGWVRGPGSAVVTNPQAWGRLEAYVKGVVSAFARDERILAWDIYNEPGNNNMGEQSLSLLQAAFGWTRAANPIQPLTAGVWFDHGALNAYQLEASDVITFHNYRDAANLDAEIDRLKAHGRPLICTEYMSRPNHSTFQACLPVFKRRNVGCMNWGLVSGKTQTIYPWGSPQGAPEPPVWFHDVFRADGSPYIAEEVEWIKRLVKHGR